MDLNLLQILAGAFLVLLMTEAPGSFMRYPRWSGAFSTSFLAFSIAICASLFAVLQRRLVIGSPLDDIPAYSKTLSAVY
jgi:hypothetical protein